MSEIIVPDNPNPPTIFEQKNNQQEDQKIDQKEDQEEEQQKDQQEDQKEDQEEEQQKDQEESSSIAYWEDYLQQLEDKTIASKDKIYNFKLLLTKPINYEYPKEEFFIKYEEEEHKDTQNATFTFYAVNSYRNSGSKNPNTIIPVYPPDQCSVVGKLEVNADGTSKMCCNVGSESNYRLTQLDIECFFMMYLRKRSSINKPPTINLQNFSPTDLESLITAIKKQTEPKIYVILSLSKDSNALQAGYMDSDGGYHVYSEQEKQRMKELVKTFNNSIQKELAQNKSCTQGNKMR